MRRDLTNSTRCRCIHLCDKENIEAAVFSYHQLQQETRDAVTL